VRGLELEILGEGCFYFCEKIIVSYQRHSVGGVCTNPGNLHATFSIQTTPLSFSVLSKYRWGLPRFFEKFYDGEQFLPFSPLAAEIYNTVFSVDCIMCELCRSPILMPCLKTNYCIQIIETGFADQF
jgi:hypothetical protein